MMARGRDGESAEIYRRGMADFDALSPEEKARFDLMLRSFLMRIESGRQAISFGLGPEASSFEERVVTDLLAQDGFLSWWEATNRDLIPGPMRQLLESKPERTE